MTNNLNADRDTKRTIIGAVATAGNMCCFGIIVMALTGAPIPDQLNNLAYYTFGALTGFLAKTTIDQPAAPTQPEPQEPTP
jgi:hypothetical protein